MQNSEAAVRRRVAAARIVAPTRAATPQAVVPAAAPPRFSAAHIVVPGKTSKPSTDPRRVSAANLSVPKSKPATRPAPARCVPPRSPDEWRERLDQLRDLRDELKPVKNKNDVATALIAGCISGGICTKDKIVSMLVRLGFKNTHAGATVDRGARSPALWRKGEDGRYSLAG